MLSLKDKEVAILMATYQGQDYILEQLSSIAAQSYPHWKLYVSDDGSKDNTLEIIKAFSLENKITIPVYKGPEQGFVKNFLTMLSCNDIKGEYFAFSDQDDVWHTNKLEKALQWFEKIPASTPALYCTRTHLIDSEGKSIGHSPLFTRQPAFSNALIQSIGGGNTMVINKAARDIIVKAGIVDVISHDWWMYILISGAGGKVFHDIESTLDYRQHQGNLIGSNLGLKAKLLRLEKIFQGQYKDWNEKHIRSIDKNIDILSVQNRKKYYLFKEIHTGSFLKRMSAYFKLGLYRQSKMDSVGIFVSALFKKL
ncbi:glycosyltransferase family 2 protein [Pantoea sp. KPR_PJ]|uniref:glycosyltransferase family 2 protein n=1 Tax=Pantoea sp. KPR_PJ TaxID=2738375 RepID=UPI003527EFDE